MSVEESGGDLSTFGELNAVVDWYGVLSRSCGGAMGGGKVAWAKAFEHFFDVVRHRNRDTGVDDIPK